VLDREGLERGAAPGMNGGRRWLVVQQRYGRWRRDPRNGVFQNWQWNLN
jgi:hypothetical protein